MSLKIGIFTPTYPSVSGDGGIGKYVREASISLCGMGHEVHALTPGEMGVVRDGEVDVHCCRVDGVPLVDRVFPGTGACWRIGRAMLRLVRDHKLDVVEFPNWEGLAPYFAMRRRVPMVVRLHTSSLESMKIDGLAMNRTLKGDIRRERLTARMADVLVTHSEAHRRAMAEELEIDAERIHIVAHGISPVPRDARPVQREERTVVYLGRLERRKGTIDLLHAIPLVLKEFADARFVLIGADRAHCPGGRTHERYLAEEFPGWVQERVKLMGRLPDDEVEMWLRRASVFVAPSLYESFGLIFLEAMRWGTPVIGTRAGGIPEVVEDGKSGLLAPPGDPKGLAAAIIEMLRNRELRETLGEAGRKRCETAFSIDRMAREMASLYCEGIVRWRG